MKGKSLVRVAEIVRGGVMKKNFAFGFFAVLVLLTTTIAMADPSSRVARLQYISGDVSIQPGGVNDWVAAVINRPLTSADRVWTDKDSRSELQLGGAYLRMSGETSVTLTNVSDQTVQLELDQGTLNLRIRRLYDGEIYEVDTPNLAFTVSKAGSYRFDVDPNGDRTLVTVWRGEGEATGEGRAVEVHRDQQIQFMEGTSLQHQRMDDPEPDGFDDWCQVRDRRQDESISARYVSPDVIGYEDLDGYGTWHTVPDYGPMWVPAVAPGWAPYRYGHWVWIDPWGWTWVDDAPWGFAPCHYGRWVYYRGGWGWVPGPPRVRPVYAPALVAWVGGTHWGVSMTFGSTGGVAWFPLGYGEPYIPPYHVTRNYFQQVNVTNTKIVNITNVTNNYYVTNNNTTVVNNTNITKIVYKNQNVDGAVTAVPRNVLVNSQSVGRVAVRVPPREIASVPPTVAPPVAPKAVSVLGTGGQGALPPHVATRPVFTRVVPPERPVPFAAKQQALAANPGRPLDEQTEQQLRRTVNRQPVNVRGGMSAPLQTAAPNSPATPNGPRVAPPREATSNPQPSTVPAGPVRMVPRPPQASGPQRGVAEGPAERPQPVEVQRGMPANADRGMNPGTQAQPDAADRRVVNRPVPRPPQSQPVDRTVVDKQPATPGNNARDRVVPRPPTANPQPVREGGFQDMRPRPQTNAPRMERTAEPQQAPNVDRPVFHPDQGQRPNVEPAVRQQAPAPAPQVRNQEGPRGNAAPARAQEPRHEAPSRPAQTHVEDDHKNQQR